MTTVSLISAGAMLFGAARFAPSVPSLVAAGLALAVLVWSPATPGQAVLVAGAAFISAHLLPRRRAES